MNQKMRRFVAAVGTLANRSRIKGQPLFPAAIGHVLLAVLLVTLRLPVVAQAPAWQSAQTVPLATAGGPDNFSDVEVTAVDAAGNVYLAGNFTNTVVLGTTTLTSLGSYDVFVAKFNPASHQFVWVQQAGGTGYDLVTALTVSGTSVYVTGTFRGATANFGPIVLTNAGTNARTTDVYVAKLLDAGSTSSFAWAQRAGGLDNEFANAVGVNGTSVYVAGNFNSATASFGATTLTNANATGSPASDDVYVAKLVDMGPSGSFAWAQQGGGSGSEGITALAVLGPDVFIAGSFNSRSARFGSTTLANVSTNSNDHDVFVARLTDAGSTGSFGWAQRAGGASHDAATALTVSGSSVYVAGGFAGPTADFGTISLTVAGFNNYPDVFVTKLTNAGSFVWAQRAGSIREEYATALAVSGTSLYLTGHFVGPTVDFGTTSLANAGAASGTPDLFVAKLVDAGNMGNVVWAERAGGVGNDFAFDLALMGSQVYVVGCIQNASASFGTTGITSPYSNSYGFLASLTDPTLTATSTSRVVVPTQLYPNPARHTATLRLAAGTAPAALTLTDALGRVVRNFPVPTSPESTLDLRGLPAGLYLLRGVGPVQRLAVE